VELDKFKPKARPEPQPFKRRLWVSVILTFFGPGLPLIYCGNLKAGILLEIGSMVSALLLVALYFISPTLIALFILVIIAIVIFIGILIFNVRYTRSTNDLKIPRFNKAWTWIIIVFVGLSAIQESASLLIKSYVCEAYHIPSTAMEKTLLVGDYILVDKSFGMNELHTGDLLIFKYPKDPSQNYIKRLIAKAGDRIKIEDKLVYLNGEKLDEPYAQHADSRTIPYYAGRDEWGMGIRDNMPEITIPEGALFVLGDNRDNSSDSRFWGFLDQDLVKGKARVIHFSWDSENNRVRWDRIGTRLDQPLKFDNQ